MGTSVIIDEKKLADLTEKAKTAGMTVEAYLKSTLGDDVDITVQTPPVNNPDLDFLFVEADRVQTEVEKLVGLGTEMMDCPECGGQGRISGGSLGDMCVNCDGSGTVSAPFAEKFDIPDMAAYRRELQAAEKTMKLGGTVDLPALKAKLEEHEATARATADIVKGRLAPAASAGKRKGLGGRRPPALKPRRDVVDEVLDEAEGDGEED